MTAIFPGSFDPFTAGHEALVYRALQLFDNLTIAIGFNSEKRYMFDIAERLRMTTDLFDNEHRVSVIKYSGLTVDLCRSLNTFFLVRGLRTAADFEFERAVGQTNKQLEQRIETVFMLIAPDHSAISSSIVRDIIMNAGDASIFLPKGINIENYRRNY
jgi:pantetheine-phosphate adenylyltransferase